MATSTAEYLAEVPAAGFRVIRIAGILIGYGLIFGPALLVARLRGKRLSRTGERLSAMLIALGPTYIKFGQVLSTRRDLLPEEVCAAFGRLADDAPPPRRAAIERVLRDSYAGRESPFAAFEWTPTASGSIATVHRAITHDGRRVAVKVRRPGIARVMRLDFMLSALAMGALQRLPGMESMPFKVMHAQVGGAILRQVDFAAERVALADLRDNLLEFDWIRIPAPLPEFCSDDVLVMEHVDGLARISPESFSPATRKIAARRVMSAVYQMLFVDGLVHCDLHPGNLYINSDGALVILDAGFVIRLPESVRASFADFFINMAMGNGPLCAEIIIDSASSISQNCDLKEFRSGLNKLVSEATGAQSSEFSLARFAGRLFELQRRFGLYPAPEFAFPLLSLLVVEGIVQSLDPELDFQAEATPILRRRNMPRATVRS